MAPRWIKTKDAAPHMFRANESRDDDLLLMSGGWNVGRVMPASAMLEGRYNWSLNGPHTPNGPVPTHGDVATLEEAKAELLTSWRRWQVWAGMLDAE